MSDDLPLPSDQAAVRYDIWGKAILAGFIVGAPPLVIGLLTEVNPLSAEDFAESWNLQVFLQVFLPGVIMFLVMNGVFSRLTSIFGFGMLKESSKDISLKAAVSTNMQSLGVMLALFLTILIGMLMGSPPSDDTLRGDLWSLVFLILAMEACVRGLTMTALFLIYNEPLTDEAAKHFAVDNMLYLGEPTTCLIATVVYFMWTCALMVFRFADKWLGVFASLALTYVTVRAMVVAQYLNAWKNPILDDNTRANRSLILKNVQEVDGTSVTHKRSH